MLAPRHWRQTSPFFSTPGEEKPAFRLDIQFGLCTLKRQATGLSVLSFLKSRVQLYSHHMGVGVQRGHVLEDTMVFSVVRWLEADSLNQSQKQASAETRVS